MTRTYLIIQTEDLDKVDFTKILQTSKDTVKKSTDETKSIIKWEDVEPDFVNILTNTEGPYTHSEIIEILSTKEWENIEAPLSGSIN